MYAKYILKVLVFIVLAASAAQAAPVTLANLPACDWYHGCGPAAAASVLGYWDLDGYADIFAAADPPVYLTASVEHPPPSPTHDAKRAPTPCAIGAVPSSADMANRFGTSADLLEIVRSCLSCSDHALVGFTSSKGCAFKRQNGVQQRGAGCRLRAGGRSRDWRNAFTRRAEEYGSFSCRIPADRKPSHGGPAASRRSWCTLILGEGEEKC